GDPIHYTVSKNSIVIFRRVICEHEIYSMKNFIVQSYGKSTRTIPHKYKLSFYTKMFMSRLTLDTFFSTCFDSQSMKKLSQWLRLSLKTTLL
ncbi:hypothetical protein HN51_032675, partial [Arachis hypogaea]